MASLPRPLLALLGAAILAFAAWTFVLGPHSSSSSTTTTPAPVTHATTPSKHSAATKHAAGAKAASATTVAPPQLSAAARREAAVNAALLNKQVLALLFYNPAGADDQADRQMLATVPTDGGKVFKLAVPVSELARYSAVTKQVQVTGTPTIVVIDEQHQARTLTGLVDELEVGQLVKAALAG